MVVEAEVSPGGWWTPRGMCQSEEVVLLPPVEPVDCFVEGGSGSRGCCRGKGGCSGDGGKGERGRRRVVMLVGDGGELSGVEWGMDRV